MNPLLAKYLAKPQELEEALDKVKWTAKDPSGNVYNLIHYPSKNKTVLSNKRGIGMSLGTILPSASGEEAAKMIRQVVADVVKKGAGRTGDLNALTGLKWTLEVNEEIANTAGGGDIDMNKNGREASGFAKRDKRTKADVEKMYKRALGLNSLKKITKA